MVIIVIHFPAGEETRAGLPETSQTLCFYNLLFFVVFFTPAKVISLINGLKRICVVESNTKKARMKSLWNLWPIGMPRLCTFQSRMRLHSVNHKSSSVSPTLFLSFSSSSSAFLEGLVCSGMPVL